MTISLDLWFVEAMMVEMVNLARERQQLVHEDRDSIKISAFTFSDTHQRKAVPEGDYVLGSFKSNVKGLKSISYGVIQLSSLTFFP